MKKDVVLYDFDGTIYGKDSFVTFILFAVPKYKMLLGFFICLPTMVKLKFKIISNESCKKFIFSHFFKGMNINVFDAICVRFGNVLNKNINNIIMLKIKDNQHLEHVIVSASVSNWIKPWAVENGIDHVIATEIEVDDLGNITGDFSTRNCNNIEKVFRVKTHFSCDKFYIEAYGNSESDYAMFGLAESAFLVKGDKLIKFK